MKLKYLSIVGLCLCVAFTSCKKDKDAAFGKDAPQVKVTTVKSEEIGQSEVFTATVEGDVKNNISPNTPMRIKNILVEVGDKVSKGQVLAILDQTSMSQVDAQIIGQQAAVQGQMASVKTQQANVKSQEASIKSYEAQVKNTEAELRRIEALYKAGGVSQSDYDATVLQCNMQKLALEAQRDQLNALNSAVNAQQAQVNAQQAQVKSLQTQRAQLVENNKLISPCNGYVTARNYDNGDMYTSLPVVTIEQTSRVKLMINVSEIYYQKIKKGMPVDITLDAYEGETFPGTVSIVYPAIDNTTHTFPVEIVMENNDQKVRPGMFARAKVNFEYKNHVVIPDEALVKQMGAGDRYVYIYDPAKKAVRYQKVELGKHMGNKYEIISGVNVGDQVVIAGQTRLSNGKQVEVVK